MGKYKTGYWTSSCQDENLSHKYIDLPYDMTYFLYIKLHQLCKDEIFYATYTAYIAVQILTQRFSYFYIKFQYYWVYTYIASSLRKNKSAYSALVTVNIRRLSDEFRFKQQFNACNNYNNSATVRKSGQCWYLLKNRTRFVSSAREQLQI